MSVTCTPIHTSFLNRKEAYYSEILKFRTLSVFRLSVFMPKDGEASNPKKARKKRAPSKLQSLRKDHRNLVRKLKKELRTAERDLRSLFPSKAKK